MPFLSVYAMLAFEEVSRSLPSDAKSIPFSSLPYLVLEMIVVMTEVIIRWFWAHFVHTSSVAMLRWRLAVTFPFDFNAPAELIRTRLCRVCTMRTRGSFRLFMHYVDYHPREWSSIGHSLEHNRMPLPLPF